MVLLAGPSGFGDEVWALCENFVEWFEPHKRDITEGTSCVLEELPPDILPLLHYLLWYAHSCRSLHSLASRGGLKEALALVNVLPVAHIEKSKSAEPSLFCSPHNFVSEIDLFL